MTPDEALAIVATKAAGRTRWAGSEPYYDEVLAEEIGRLRATVRINAMRWGMPDDKIDDVLYPSAQTKAADPKAGG